MKILVVDDDKDIVELLSIYIKNEGYEVEKAYNGKEAITKLNTNPDIALMILDVMMPQMDGLSVVREVRKDSQIPVLMLSAKTDDLDKIQGLIQGADDYVTKPFNPLEVMARVRSLLRRSQHEVKNDEPDQIEIGPLIIKKDSHEVKTLEGKEIKLTWQQESVVSAKTVMVHVSHLRDKIEEATDGEKVIQTVWGVGYKIEAR